MGGLQPPSPPRPVRLCNPVYNPSHSAPVLGTSGGSAVFVGVPAGGANEHGVQEMIVANSNSTVPEIRDNVLFPPALTFERQRNASAKLPVQPPPSYEATVREILYFKTQSALTIGSPIYGAII